MIKLPFNDSNSDSDSDDDVNTIKINVKRIKNSDYDIILSQYINKSNINSSYYCINCKTKIKYIVDVYDHNFEATINEQIELIKKIKNNNITKIIDIINYKTSIYIIRDIITKSYNFCEKTNEENLNNYKIILDVIKYLLNLKIKIDIIKIDNIYEENNNIIILPTFIFTSKKNNNIIYGSPIYSPKIKTKINNKIEDENNNLSWNLGILLYQIIYKVDIFELYNKRITDQPNMDITDINIGDINIKNIILNLLNNKIDFDTVYSMINKIDKFIKNIDIEKSDDSSSSVELEIFTLEDI
jgi:hypothetical protein